MLKGLRKYTFLMMTLSFSYLAYGHGEDKPGPNGGYIRMPGAFHVEVVPEKDNSYVRIYLLDLSWKNPMTANSTVVASLKNSENFSDLMCTPEKTFFTCKSKNNLSFKSGELVVKAARNGLQGAPAIYKLPLNFQTAH